GRSKIGRQPVPLLQRAGRAEADVDRLPQFARRHGLSAGLGLETLAQRHAHGLPIHGHGNETPWNRTQRLGDTHTFRAPSEPSHAWKRSPGEFDVAGSLETKVSAPDWIAVRAASTFCWTRTMSRVVGPEAAGWWRSRRTISPTPFRRPIRLRHHSSPCGRAQI